MGSYGSEYYGAGDVNAPMSGSDKNIRQMKDHFYQTSYPQNAAFWQQAAIDKRFKVGDQALWSAVYGDGQYMQSRRFFFNLIRRNTNMICGYQRKNRKSTISIPTQQDTDALCDDYNKALKWSEDRDGFQEYFSQAFEGCVDTGMSLLHLYPDYTLDPISGDLFTDQVACSNFLIDSYFRKQDLSDCNFIWRRRWVSKEVAKALLPGRANEINKMNPTGVKDGRFPLQAELLNLASNNLFAYDEFHYRTTREATIVTDPMTGESAVWDDDDEDSEDLLKSTMQFQPWLKVHKKQIPTVKLSIALGNVEMYHGRNLLNIDEYPFVPTLCYHEPDIQSYAWRIQGVIRNLRDCQYLYNSRVGIMEDILRSQINSGWIYPVDVLTDPKALRQSGQGFLVPLKAGHLPNEIQRIEPPAIPASMMELANMLSNDITKISGVNEELLGAASDDKSGILSMLRQGAGLVTLQGIFDKADYSQRLYGKLRLKAILKNFSKGKIRAILGKDADPRFWQLSSLKYNIAVEEGNYSTSQRQMELQQLLHFKEIGMPIADKSILQAAFITNKQQVIADMQENAQQQQQAQQVQMQEESKKTNADVMSKYAKSKADLALEKERLASVQEKLAKVEEISSSADHKKMESDLSLVKMMLELESMDFEQMRAAFDMAQAIKQANEPQKQGVV